MARPNPRVLALDASPEEIEKSQDNYLRAYKALQERAMRITPTRRKKDAQA